MYIQATKQQTGTDNEGKSHHHKKNLFSVDQIQIHTQGKHSLAQGVI